MPFAIAWREVGRQLRLYRAVRHLDKAQSLLEPEMRGSVDMCDAWIHLWKVLRNLR